MDDPALTAGDHAAIDAIEDAVRRCTFGIVTGGGTGIGTGTLIKWKGRSFILTANHVIADSGPADLRFFPPHTAPPQRVEREQLKKIRQLPAKNFRPFVKIGVDSVACDPDPRIDLAIISVPDSTDTDFHATSFVLDEDGVEPTDGLMSLVFGFPLDISRVMADDSRTVFTEWDWSPVVPARTGLEGFDPSVHFLTAYVPPTEHIGADPRGLSGAARWARKGKTPGLWHPNLDLIGVTQSYYQRSQLLKIVNRRTVVNFLKTHAKD